MKLLRFRVTNFRSVEDSGWIAADDVTALIGTNESGKTNLLLPLWKLNPANEGAISLTADYPRKLYNIYRHEKPQPVFIEAVFDVGEELAAELAQRTGAPSEAVREVRVSRRFDGERIVDFPNADPRRTLPATQVRDVLGAAASELRGTPGLKTEQVLKSALLSAIERAAPDGKETLDRGDLDSISEILGAVVLDDAPKTSRVVPRFQLLREELAALAAEITRPNPRDVEGVEKLVMGRFPKFVYYSTYGNLDSEIYLPHVIENMARPDLGPREEAKARTLKVLFEFVRLQPKEILELGRDFRDPADPARQPTADEVEKISEKKKQRSILLQSASTMLTRRFREWWRQGDYRFRFEADGNHFRIWVSDDKRPEEIELEGRSTGLQWFLSFYLVFLVESADTHAGAILLLDEPGISLHPMAQRDLSAFFDSLAQTNQLTYTTHSPFLVDADRLERARKVFVAADGTSKATDNLGAGDGEASQRGAGYAVFAALGLSVAESLLLGCMPIVVEGSSDQHYLSAIKTLLVASGRFSPGRELVFVPAHGAKGVKVVATILGGRDGTLPVVLCDSDAAGRELAKALRTSLYSGDGGRVLEMGAFASVPDAEVEDLIPAELIVRELDRWQRAPSVTFADVVKTGEAIVPQIKAWAMTHGVALELGWKVELAKRVKQSLLQGGTPALDVLDAWMHLFERLQAPLQPASRMMGSTNVGDRAELYETPTRTNASRSVDREPQSAPRIRASEGEGAS